ALAPHAEEVSGSSWLLQFGRPQKRITAATTTIAHRIETVVEGGPLLLDGLELSAKGFRVLAPDLAQFGADLIAALAQLLADGPGFDRGLGEFDEGLSAQVLV